MNKFNVGDTVRHGNEEFEIEEFYFKNDNDYYSYKIKNDVSTLWGVSESQLELIQDTEEETPKHDIDLEKYGAGLSKQTYEYPPKEEELLIGKEYKLEIPPTMTQIEYVHFEDLTVLKEAIRYISVDLVVKDITQGKFGKGLIVVLEDEAEFHLSYPNDDACYKDFRLAQKQLYSKLLPSKYEE